MTRYDAVIFDNDGVLTEPTEGELLDRAAESAFEGVGIEPAPEHVAALNEGPSAAVVEDICDEHGVDNQHATIEHIVEAFDLADVFETWYGRVPSLAGMRRRKPDPHYLERALDDLGARNALYVGDSRVDIAAARAAGVDVAFVRRPHREGYELETEPTHHIEGLDALRGIVREGTPATDNPPAERADT